MEVELSEMTFHFARRREGGCKNGSEYIDFLIANRR